MAKYLKNEKNLLVALVFMLPFAFGLYHEFTAYIAGVLITLLTIYIVAKNKKVQLVKKAGFICLIVSYLFYGVSVLYAVDTGMAFAGFLKIIPIAIFILLLMQYEKDTVQRCLNTVPYSAVMMLALAAVTWYIPNLKDYFYNNGRLGGFFQYSNTFALYLLLGIIVLGNLKKKSKQSYVVMVLLIIGILLTGSRTIFILLCVNFIYFFIKNQKLRKPILVFGTIILLIVALFVGITSSLENIGRFLTIDLQESTFLGRILYAKDGLKLLLQHPLGLGYYGYYYFQSSIQTGVYTVRFIHNDWLQFALDVGIIGFTTHIIGLFAGIKQSDTMKKQIFITIVVSSFFDFNIQFTIIPIILMMTLTFVPKINIKKNCFIRSIVISLSAFVCGLTYFAFAFGFAYFDHYDKAIAWYKGNTEAKIAKLQISEDKQEINRLSNEIISTNKHVALAYDAKALLSFSDKDYDKMIDFKKNAIKNRKYDINVYEEYLQMLSTAIDAENEKENRKKVDEYAEEVFAVPEMLEVVKKATDPLAWQINDKPKLELSEVSKAYIDRLKEALE